MRLIFVYDMDQYQWVLNPMLQVCRDKGHTVIKCQTTPKKNADIDATVAIQSPSGFRGSQGLRVWLQHGVGLKGWGVSRYVRGKNRGLWVSPGKYWTDYAREHGFDDCMVIETGWPKVDWIRQLATDRSAIKKKVYEKFQWDKSKPFVLYMPTYFGGPHAKRQFRHPGQYEFMKDPGYIFKIMGHQLESQGTRKLFRKADSVIWASGLWKWEIFMAADLFISDTSGVGVESCALFERPLLLLKGDGARAGYLHLATNEGMPGFFPGPWVNNKNVKRVIEQQLANPGMYADARKWWAEYMMGPLDGKSSNRVVDAIEETLKKRR